MRRKAIWLGVLLLAPFAVYWQTVFHEFGFRDDYSLLREVHEEPGKVLRLTVSNGRPVQGLALGASLRAVRDVTDFRWLRLLTVVVLAAVALVLFRELRKKGWSDAESTAIALGIALLPGAQITVGWAISWPIALALLFAVLGFVVVEAQLQRAGPRRVAALAGGAFLYLLAALTYQSNAFFVIVPLAALLLVRGENERLGHLRWVAAHLGILLASLATAYLLTQLFFTEGLAPAASRMQLEPELLLKVWWFVRQPLVNSLALFELRDRFDTSLWFWVVAASVGALVALGFRFGARDASHRLRWLFCLLVLPFVAHAVSIAASSQAIGYRTMFSLSGLVLVLLVFALRSVVEVGRIRPRLQYGCSLRCSCSPPGPLTATPTRSSPSPRTANGSCSKPPRRRCGWTPTPMCTSFVPESTTARRSRSTTTSSARCRRMRTGRPRRCSGPRCVSDSRSACRREQHSRS